MNSLFNEEYFEKYLRFEYDTRDKILPLLKNNGKDSVRKILEMLYSARKKPIPDSVINLFYTDPTRFFREYHKLLNDCCFLDSLGNPILVHYFNVLNEEYRQRNNKPTTLQNCNFEIYKSNFETFIKENEKFLLIHDFSLDTPLHKLVKKPDKGLFIEIYEKLKRLNLINNEILLVTNVDGESIYNYIFKEIKYNYPKIKDNDFYYKFINDNNSINESLSQEDQNLIKEYKSKVIFNNIKYDKNNFDNVFNNFNDFVNKNDNIFTYIYHYFNSGINYLNCLYAICSQNEHYDKMYKLVSKLSTKNEMQQEICISEWCIIDHIRYVLSKLNFYGKNIENEMNYVKKLIKEILKNILKNKNKDEKKIILYCELRRRETLKNGLINTLVRNPYLDFEKKIELFDLFHEITDSLSDKFIEKNTSKLYKIFKVLEKVQPSDKNVFSLYSKYDSLKDLIDNNVFYRRLIKDDTLGRILDKKYSSFNDIIEDRVTFFMKFLKKYNYNKFKNIYNVTEQQSKKIFRLLIIFEQAIYNLNYKNEDDLYHYLENIGIICNYEIPSEEFNSFKKMQKIFVGSDKTMTEALLDYYLQLFKKSTEFMEPFMDIALCPYHDLSGYIFNYQNVYCVVEELFVKYYGKFNYNKEIADHESNRSDENKEKEHNEEKETLKLKVFQKNLPALKGLPFSNTYYAFLMMISSTVGKIELLLSEEKEPPFFKNYLKTINILYFPKICNRFGEPFDYSGIIKMLNKYTLPLSKIFIKYINTFKAIMNEFVPNLDIEPYLKAMKYIRDETEYHVKNNNYKENELPKDIVNNFIFLMIFIYIKKKYDQDYPNLSNFIAFHMIFKDSSEIINTAEECFAKNNFKDIFNKIIFEEPLISDVKYKILDYYTQNYNSFHEYFIKVKKATNKKYKSFLKGFAYIDNLESTNPKYKYEKFLPDYEEKKSIRNLLYLDFSNVPNISEIIEFSKCGVEANNHEDENNEEHEDENNDEEYNYNKKDKKDKKEKEREVLTDCNGYKYVFQNYFGKPSFSEFFSLLDEPCDKMNKYMIKKIISIIDRLSLVCKTLNAEDYISDEKEIRDLYNKKLYGKHDIFFNIHQLFLCLKEEKKTLFNILNNSQLFIILFYNYLYCVYYNSQIGKILGKEKTNFIKNEIYDFVKTRDTTNNKNLFFNFIIKNDSDATTYITNEIKQFKDRNVYDKLKNNLDTLKYETFLRLSPNFEKILKYFVDNKNKELLIDFLNFCSKCQTKFKDDQYIKSANVLGYVLSLIFKIMEKNIETFVNYLPDIKPIFESYEKGNELIKKYLITNIFKSNKFDLLNNSFVQYQMNISFNFDSYLLYLNKTKNNGENKYIYKKLKELNPDENNIFIKFLENKIMNEYVFDNLIKVVSKKQNKSFFDNNKVFIIKSLYIYSQINGFYYIDKLLKYIKTFTSEEEVKKIIYPSEGNDQYPHILNNYFKLKSTTDRDYEEQEGEEGNESYHSSNNNRNNNNDDDSDLIFINNEIEKNLLYYSIYQRNVLNYETIGVLLNYCPKETAILNIFPTIYNRNKVFDFHIINYLDYFSKNKDSIKSCNKFFYNFSLFLESLSNPKNNYESLMSLEKNIFFLYLQINVLEITPAQLFSKRFYSRDNEQLNKIIDKLLYIIKTTDENSKINKDCSELELFSIFALYEIKGIPLIPIKKYIPEFYAKIENYVRKFKSYKISDVCLKSSFDVKFYEYFMNNIKNNTLQVITDFKNYYNAIFILEKEYSNITNIQNKKEIYLQKAIYNLIFNGGISPFYDNETKTDEFLSILKRNEVSDDYNCQMNSSCFIKECIFSLKNFNRSSSSIIQKLTSNDYDSKGWICYYVKYLQIIKNICGYIMCYSTKPTEDKNKKNNDFTINKYDIFALRDILFKDKNNIFDSLKNSIDVNQIKYYIIEGLKKSNINKNENIFYDMTINWLDKYLQQKDITMKITELSKMSFFNYFNYVYLYCEILISWLNKVEDMLAYKKDEDKDFKLDIKLFENTDKNVSKKNYGDSLLILGRQCMNVYKSDNNINATLSMFYYFDENFGDYVEASNGVNLYYFINNKLYLIKNFLKEIKKYYNEEIQLITEKIDKRDNSFFQYLMDSNLYFKQNKELFKNYTPLTDKILEKNQNFIATYLENTAGNVTQPKYYDCVEYIKYQFNYYLNSFIYPALLFNNEIGAFCENRFLSFDLLKYKNYVNFYEMINSIINSNYHKDNILNELFKVRAINYILNNDSLIHIYIDEIYKLKRDNINSKIEYFKERNKPLTDTFIIKIDEKGKKYGKSDFNRLKDALENNNNDLDYSKLISSKPIKNQNKGTKKKKIKYKLKINDTQSKSKLYFASYVNNPYRKENVPILGYSGNIPNEKFDFGLTKSKQIEKAFLNEFYKKEKNNITIFESLMARDEERNNNKNKKGKKQVKNNDKFVNVFDLMFTVKSVNRNVIELYKNDISGVLSQYSEPKVFNDLLNHAFPKKEVKDVNINWDLITKYVNDNP